MLQENIFQMRKLQKVILKVNALSVIYVQLLKFRGSLDRLQACVQ